MIATGLSTAPCIMGCCCVDTVVMLKEVSETFNRQISNNKDVFHMHLVSRVVRKDNALWMGCRPHEHKQLGYILYFWGSFHIFEGLYAL